MSIQITHDESNYYDYEIEADQNTIDELNEALNLTGSTQAIKKGSGYFRSSKNIPNTLKIVENFKLEQEPKEAVKTRKLATSLMDAKNRGLTYGKTWIASQDDVDTGKVPAGFEGERVCYVYN